ncbi:MAG: hypothetical protein V5783_00675 [Pontiella sp.]
MKKKILIISGGILIALAPLQLLSGVAYTLMSPEIYEGNSILQLTFPQNSNQQYTKDALLGLTQQKAERIRTSDIYFQVIIQHELQKKWGHEGRELPFQVAQKILDSNVKLNVDPEAVGLIRMTVESTSPEEAAEISNALARAFKSSNSDISIIDFAHAEIRPVSPNLFKDVLFVILRSLIFIGIGASLFIVGIKIKKPAH